MKNKTILILVILFLASLILSSCSQGGGSGAISGAGSSSRGKLAINIAWPVPEAKINKFIPAATDKITIDITGTGLSAVEHKEYSKPVSGVLNENIGLPIGEKTIEIKALNASGTVLASRITSTVIVGNQTTLVSATLGATIQDTGFTPSTMAITTGTTLLFVNNGSTSHTVTAVGGEFDSGTITVNNSWSYTFNTVGVFNYRDDYNTSLTGTITVSDSNAPPDPPSGLTATAFSSTRIDLNWTDNSSNETGFKIERKTGLGGTYAEIAIVAAGVTTYNNTGLTPATNYYYKVRAYNDAGNSDYSNEANATTADVAPAAPSGLSATTVSTTQIDLTWTSNSTNETGFKIERKPGILGAYTQVSTVAAGVTTFNDSGLIDGTQYYYRVRAYNDVGNSNYSNEANATTAVAAPSGLSATTISTSQINLSWTNNSSTQTGVKIERKTGLGGIYAQIATVGAAVTAYNNTGLTPATAYYYRVRAYNDTGDSAYSNEANATTNTMYAYATCFGGKLIKINVSTNEVINTFDVPYSGQARGMEFRPGTALLYIAANNGFNSRVVVFDTNTDTWVTNVDFGDVGHANAYDVAFNTDGSYAYVSGDSPMQVINTSTYGIEATIDVGMGRLAAMPNSNYIYEADFANAKIFKIDTSNNTKSEIAAYADTSGIAITPNGRYVYVGRSFASMLIIDTTTDTVVGTVDAGSGNYNVAINSAGTRAYAQCGDVNVIDLNTNLLITTIDGNAPQLGIAVSPDDSRVYSCDGAGFTTITAINALTNEKIIDIDTGTGNSAYAIAFKP